ncbi:carbohydrate kinase family protein [Poriferisphaera sp. WC338]|uniref:carbohydrate kinase family protein n=1 Tax=Poriferisphaera sp. WC338 TaxID=3425129 RepID=UPI003D81262F
MDEKLIDCVVCGSCVADILCGPVPLDVPLGEGQLHHVNPIQLIGGGITSNSGITLAKLGRSVKVFTYIGNDSFGQMLTDMFERSGVDTSSLLVHPEAPTSTTAVLVSESGERTFLHANGAPKKMDMRHYYKHIETLEQARVFLWGYYGLNPNIESDLPKLLEELRARKTRTVIDSAGDGGSLSPLDKMLPHLDLYVPSLIEAQNQTGLKDPDKIIEKYRSLGAPGILGVKLGEKGALLSSLPNQYLEVAAIKPPGEVIDTTGAGDSFLAGLISGLLENLSLEECGKLAVAAGACAVTTVGGWCGSKDRAAVGELAGIKTKSK